jgi:hypothetical protein
LASFFFLSLLRRSRTEFFRENTLMGTTPNATRRGRVHLHQHPGAFLGTYSLGDLSDFANGKLGFTNNSTFSSFSQTNTPYAALHFVFPARGFYASDDWNITKNLKLNLGLRMEINQNPNAQRNVRLGDYSAGQFSRLFGFRGHALQPDAQGKGNPVLRPRRLRI